MKKTLALGLLLLSSSALAGVPKWTISEMSGPVAVGAAGVQRIAVRGGALNAGDVISTGVAGRAVLIRGGEYIVVSPNSRIRVADPAKSGPMTQIGAERGTTVYRIRKKATPYFAVETPYLAAVVKGTTFSVTVTESGASVQVVEGRVEVATRDGGARWLALPGDIGSVSASALGSLNVQGRESRTIVSPTAGAAPVVTTSQLFETPAPTAAPVTPRDEPSIVVAVAEPPVRLAGLTGGLVEGGLVEGGLTAAVALTVATVSPVATGASGGAPVAVGNAAPPPVVAAVEAPSVVPGVPPETVAAGSAAHSAPPVVPVEVAAAIPALLPVTVAVGTPPLAAETPLPGSGGSNAEGGGNGNNGNAYGRDQQNDDAARNNGNGKGGNANGSGKTTSPARAPTWREILEAAADKLKLPRPPK